jgi:hypothetical protein
VVLLAIASIGVWHACRTARAQYLYWRSKHGPDNRQADKVFSNCDRAYRLYPHNYRFSTWTAEKAWYGRYENGAEGTVDRVAIAKRWSTRGLGMNPHVRELQLVKARWLADESINEAILSWRSFLEREFWDSFNHAVMVELYSRGGRYEDALDELAWVKDPKDLAYARQTIQQAWQDEIRGLQQQ